MKWRPVLGRWRPFACVSKISGTGAHHLEVSRDRPRSPVSERIGDSRRPRTVEKGHRVWADSPAAMRISGGGGRARRWIVIPCCRRGARGCRLRVSSPATAAHGQGHDRPRRVHQHDRRSGVRRDAATRTRGAAPAIAVPQPHLRRPHPKNAAVDEPAGGCAIDSRYCAGRVRADRQRRRPGRIDRGARQSVRPRACARRTARPATSSPTSRRRRHGKKMS